MKKKILPILLCLALMPGIAGIPAFAAEFTDSAKIGTSYREAVQEMAERSVLDGYNDGSFHAEYILTREQGAKIITCLCIGKAAALKLSCEKAPFDDVAAERWSARYIAWCVEHNIIHGYGNGRFGPEDTLTGDQYAKMLMRAMGLAREEKYSSDSAEWAREVREDARAAGLYDGDPSMESAGPVSRGQAALLSWNSVKASEAKSCP